MVYLSGAITAALVPLAEQSAIRNELIDAWRADDCKRFQAAINSIPALIMSSAGPGASLP